MQPTEGFSVPRRALDVEDYIDIVRRHRGWIFGPFLFCLTAAVVGGYLWPDTYISKGAIKVEPQQLPTSLVQPVMTQDMWDQINSMLQSIESRDTLTSIVNTFGLYPKERSREPMEDVLDQMRHDIKIDALGPQSSTNHDVPAFTVSFSYPDRRQANKVVADLINRFVDINLTNQSNRTFQTTEFLKNSTEDAKKDLEDVENRLEQYKLANNGRLPEQRQENYQKLQSLETEQGNTSANISRLSQEKLMLQGNLDAFKRQLNDLAAIRPQIQAQQEQKSPKRQQAEQNVEAWSDKLRQLQERFKDSYPDVVTAKQELAAAEKKLDAIVADEKAAAQKAASGKSTVNPTQVKEQAEQQLQIERAQIQINSIDEQIAEAQSDMKKLSANITAVQNRLNSAPESEKQYDDLLRERELKKEHYEELSKNLVKAQQAQDMQNKNFGSHFQILDPASTPDTPAFPNHVLVVVSGGAIGLLLGIVIVGAREMKDTSLKNLKDVRAYTQLAILCSIPLLENDFVVRRRRRMAWLGWTTACLVSAVLMAGSIVYYLSSKTV